MNRLSVLLVLVATFFLVQSEARADFITTATLLPGNDVPPQSTPALGAAIAFFNSTADSLTVNVAFTGLSAPATAAHIHFGDPGVNGPIILPFSNPTFPGSASASYTTILTTADLTPSPANGINTFADAINAIAGGHTYVNVHDAVFPIGEIRGQLAEVTAAPEPSTLIGLLSMGIIGLGLAWWRRKRLG